MQTVLDGRYAADRSVVALGMFDGVHWPIGRVCRWWRAPLWSIPCS